jgi:serine/threonine protein kinase
MYFPGQYSFLSIEEPSQTYEEEFEGGQEGYKFISVIGKGSFGTVYTASSPEGGIVCIKKIPKIDEYDEILMNEIQHHYEAEHPNIVRCLQTYEDKKHAYIVMEYCEEGDLLNLFQKNREKFNNDFIRKILFEAASALKYIHSKCWAHRDIKPNNLFLTKNETIKIGDFGSSKDIADTLSNPLTTFTVGNRHFKAPELLCAKPYGRKSDIWSLGATIYYFIEGDFPFKGSDRSNLRKMRNTHIDNYVKQVVTMMMEIKPQNRPTLDDIIEQKSPFWNRLGFKKHPFGDYPDEF